MTKGQDGISVEIYDQEYHIKGDLDPEYIQELAKYVDEKMRSIAGRTRTVDSLRVAVLAALNLADECHQLKLSCESTNKRIDECTEVLDRILKQDA